MRSLYFMPLTFVAGQHGFALFAPYLAVFLATAHFARLKRKRPVQQASLAPIAATAIVAA